MVSFDDAVASLQSMFPEWDQETLKTLLITNNGHVERTIENILSMDGQIISQPTISPPSSAPSRVMDPENIEVGLEPFEVDNYNDVSIPISDYPAGAYSRPPPATSQYRGRRCVLPEDFLRVSHL